MSLLPLKKAPLRSLLLGGGVLVVASLSCGREPTGPGGRDFIVSKGLAFSTEFPPGFPAYQAAGGTGVDFTKVRIILSRTDRLTALDTTVAFPAGATDLQLTLRVPLPASSLTTGVPLVLNLDYVTADGVVVFHGGPVIVTAFPITSDSTPPPPSEVTIPIRYTGPGAGATKVVISPTTLQADSGAAFTVTAQGQDASGKVVPGTPIMFSSQDTTIATVNAATGVGKAGSKRGSTGIVAQLLSGQTSTALLTVVKPAKAIVGIGGDTQTGAVSTNLALPVKVLVISTDTLPAPGVAVTFAAQNGGTVGAATVTTAADGTAQTTWKLAATPGAQTLTATVTGLLGSPVTFTATATSTGAGTAKSLAFTSQPGPGLPGVALPSFVITARDSVNALATSFSGNVTVAFGANPGSATLSGTLTVAAVAGVATFTNVKLDNLATGYTLVASASGLTSATSSAFDIANSNVATVTLNPHFDTLTAIGSTHAITAQARDTSNVIVLGHYTWVSRTPAIATVDTNGVIKAVANGTTWVVATELGGAKDSAQVVVAQKLASIKVTPNPRSVYIGASYQFAASAVDGLGVALASQPSFTWSTGSGSVATVNPSGLALGTGIGTTNVQAASGAVTGSAVLTVKSQITRIVVSRDSAVFSKTSSDTFTIAALQRTRSYIATARDTLDQPMSGITFAWTSTNGAVAAIDSSGPATARARADANGVSAIRATAQGITGAAQLNVQQALVSIDLSPTATAVAPTGKTVLVARGKDANGYFIPGGTFTFTSGLPSIATVDAAGVVTGVALGTATITAASGAVTSNTSTITVGGTVPPAISFGRDTLTVGRSGSTSIPVYLSTPYASPLTVNLAVRDTFAFFSAASVSIPANTTSANANLNGHNAGTTEAYATDGSGAGYAGDTAVLAVQATVKLTSTSYSLNVTDYASTQVLLSDPSPAGGTYVTFTHGSPGKVDISPDPAFVPAGQLAANIVITGLAANPGGTTITPAATGVSGTASTVYTYAATFSGPVRLMLGLGQSDPYQYVEGTTYFYNALPITMVSSDSAKAVVPVDVTIPVNGYYAYYPVSAVGIGSAIITASAPGWTSLKDTVTVTTPKVGMCCSSTYNTTSPAIGVTVYAEDSLSYSHYRSDALVVSLSSSDPTVVKVVTPTLTIPAGQYYTSGNVLAPGGATGTARVIVSASGHKPDSVTYTINGPKLQFSWTAARVGTGQQDQNVYVQVPNNVTGSPLAITLANKDSSVLGAPTSISIPVGTYYTYFTVRGKAPGIDSLFATAAGYTPDTASYTVTSPRVYLSAGGTLNNFGPIRTFTTYAADSLNTTHYATSPVVVTYTSRDPSVVTVTAADTIQAGAYYSQHAAVTPAGIGTTYIVATASGMAPDSASYTVQAPKLGLSWTTTRLGRRQYASNYYVQTPDYRTADLAVTITQSQPAVDSLSQASITIPNGTYYQYFDIAGMTTGADTVIASATGYLPDTAIVVVTTPKFTVSGLPSSAATTSPASTVTVYAADSVGTTHYSLDPVVVRAISSNSAVVQPTARGFQINSGIYYAQPQVAYTGVGSASVTYDDSLATGYLPATTNTVTVTGPTLSFPSGARVYGMRQNGGVNSAYIQVPNNVTGSDLVVSLASSDPTVAQVPATVTIPVGTYYKYFQITAQDVIGTIQLTATATGYGSAAMTVQVTQPKFLVSTPTTLNATSPPQTITIYAADANGTTHPTNEDVVVTLESSAPSVGAPDSTTVTIPANAYYTQAAKFLPGQPGTTQLKARDARSASYQYAEANTNIAVSTANLSLNFGSLSLGIGQYYNSTVQAPDYQPADLTVGLAHYSATTTTPSSVTIPAGTYYTTAKIVGAATGSDTITYTATGYNAAKGAIDVAPGKLDPASWPTSITHGDSVQVTIYARDVNLGIHPVDAATTLTLTASGQIQFVSGGSGSAPITSIDIPANAQSVTVWVKALSAGTGSAQISTTNYTTYTSPNTNVP